MKAFTELGVDPKNVLILTLAVPDVLLISPTRTFAVIEHTPVVMANELVPPPKLLAIISDVPVA